MWFKNLEAKATRQWLLQYGPQGSAIKRDIGLARNRTINSNIAFYE